MKVPYYNIHMRTKMFEKDIFVFFVQKMEGVERMNEIEEQIKKQAQFAEKLSWEKIPDDVRERTKWVILDSLGCVIKGCSGIKQNEKKTKEKADRIIETLGAPCPDCSDYAKFSHDPS